MGKEKITSIPKKIEIDGLLVKAGGKDGQKKKEERYFTLGDNMIAYFNCKKKADCTLKTAKGTFPVNKESCVERLGAAVTVKGFSAPMLPFAITSNGRRFQLWAADAASLDKWIEAVETMIEYLDSRASSINSLDKSISQFSTASSKIVDDLVEKSTEMKSKFGDAVEKLEAHKAYMLNKFSESMQTENPSQARKAATAEMDKDSQALKKINAAMDEVDEHFKNFLQKLQEAADAVVSLGAKDGEEPEFVATPVEAVDIISPRGDEEGLAEDGEGEDEGEDEGEGEGEDDGDGESQPEPE